MSDALALATGGMVPTNFGTDGVVTVTENLAVTLEDISEITGVLNECG